jgi:PAS domain-containing protein
LVLNAVVEGICGLQAEGNVTFCNDALLKMTRYRTEEIVGKNLQTLLRRSQLDNGKYRAGEPPGRKEPCKLPGSPAAFTASTITTNAASCR